MTPDGLLVVDKPPDWTSHDVVARARRLLGTRKIGHAGTLDPMATGVLLLGVGRATRLLGYLSLATKGYDATIRLGASTTTDDAMGTPVSTGSTEEITAVTEESIRTAIRAFVGDIDQVPSAVSAIKVDGERAYKRVRAGEEVNLKARRVTVSEYTVLAIDRAEQWIDVHCHVECSTGTYIRALARDLGVELGIGGHLTALRRTRVGPYDVAAARPMGDDLADGLISLDDAAEQNFDTFVVDAEHEFAIRNGRAITARLRPSDDHRDQPVAVLSESGEFLALYAQHGPTAQARGRLRAVIDATLTGQTDR